MAEPESSHKHERETLANKVRAIVSRTSGGHPVADDDLLSRDLGLDAAARTELLMAIELSFRVHFAANETATLVTVGNLIAAVATKLQHADPATDVDQYCPGGNQ